MDALTRLVENVTKYLSKKDFSHLEDVCLSHYESGNRGVYLALPYDDCGSEPLLIENDQNYQQRRSCKITQPKDSYEDTDEEFSSTEDNTPVDRVKRKKKRRRRSLLTDSTSLFALEL